VRSPGPIKYNAFVDARLPLCPLVTLVTVCCIALASYKHYGKAVLPWVVVVLALWRKSQSQDIGDDVRGIGFLILALLTLKYFE